MAGVLDMLRTFARDATVPQYETNERNEKTARGDGARVNSFNSFFSSPDTAANTEPEDEPHDDCDERAAIIEEGAGVPRAWAEGYAALRSMPPPVGVSSERWHGIIDGAGKFLDQWAAKAVSCGWSDLDIFGADPDRPAARFDAMGLVLQLDRRKVVSIDRDGADLVTDTGALQRFRRRLLPPGTVSLWAFRHVPM